MFTFTLVVVQLSSQEQPWSFSGKVVNRAFVYDLCLFYFGYIRGKLMAALNLTSTLSTLIRAKPVLYHVAQLEMLVK